jgi:predicted dinucleotide-binding enzyme
VVLLAVWPDALEEVLRDAGSLAGKTIITCVSGLKPDFTGQTIGLPTDMKMSMAERIAQLAPGSSGGRSISNVTFAQTLAAPSRRFGPDRPSVFYCGDSEAAKRRWPDSSKPVITKRRRRAVGRVPFPGNAGFGLGTICRRQRAFP